MSAAIDLFVTLDRRIVVPGFCGLDPADLAAMPERARAVFPDDRLPLALVSDVSSRGGPPGSWYTLSPGQAERLAAGAGLRFAVLDRAAAVLLARRGELVARVRQLRVGEGRTWRAVARALHQEPVVRSWSELPADQLVGIALCKAAAQRLGQDFMEEPWN